MNKEDANLFEQLYPDLVEKMEKKMSNEYNEWVKLEIQNFVEKYCKQCGTQRCEGPGTEWVEGCPHWIREFEELYETVNNRS